jgi:hypothetical protein
MPGIQRQLSNQLQQRQFVIAILPVVVVGGAAAFAYITWSQVQEKRRLREAQEAKSPPKTIEDDPTADDQNKKS